MLCPQKQQNAAFLVEMPRWHDSKCVGESKDALVMLAEKVVPAASARVAATKAFATTAEALATTTKAFL